MAVVSHHRKLDDATSKRRILTWALAIEALGVVLAALAVALKP